MSTVFALQNGAVAKETVNCYGGRGAASALILKG